jgi:hypothetical protein
MSSHGIGEACGHSSANSTWTENKTVDEEVLETFGELEPSEKVIGTSKSAGIASAGVSSSTTVLDVKAAITPSAEDRAVSEAIEAIEDLTSDFDAATDESNTEELPNERTPKASKRRHNQIPKSKSSQKNERPRIRPVNDSPGNKYSRPLPTDDAYEKSLTSSLWTDDESWNTPSYLRFNPERLLLFQMQPERKTMRRRFSLLKHRVANIARTDLDWVKETITSIRTKAGTEISGFKANSAENLQEGSVEISNLSLRGGAGDISSLNGGGGNDTFGFSGEGDNCVSNFTHKSAQY